MTYIIVGISILVVVVGAVIYAVVAMRADKSSTRITAFGEAPDDANPPS
jgi:heme/copper-type cytochrome/quinol oxidase subunit 2